MGMNLGTAKQSYASMAYMNTQGGRAPLPVTAVARSGGSIAGAMFSHNMSHLRGAKPCGSCGGR
jgi:uncharacterized membrane protein